MMIESAESLLSRAERALEDYTNYERTMRNIADLTNIVARLSPLSQSLRQVTAGFTALDQIGMPVERPDLAKTATALRTVAALVRTSRTLPKDPGLDLKTMEDIERRARREIADSWRSFVTSCVSDLDSLGQLADVLRRVGADPSRVGDLQSGVRELRRLAGQMPDETVVSQVTRGVVTIRAALAVLVGGAGEQGDEIRQFVEGVMSGGAPVRALTPVVLDWMRKHGIEQSFRILAGRPAHD